MREVLKKLGKYFLLDQIAQGGMAEIYRARLASIDGAGRLLVIKRVQSGYGTNKEFLQMFRSEIKVTMGFNHSNIAQLYDFGEEQGLPYIAMEYIDGKNLRQFMARFHELKQSFPVDLAAYIVEQAACGLHYAHSFKDKITGEALNIIHRDISPQNVLIAYEGSVKVIDFGIAKATTNSEFTRAGVIKGKPSYLSPEQISGETLDGRCDIFALGAVLWEMLCGKKLFQGENDLAVLKLIESCNTTVKPPSTVNPKVPKELDAIVLKALAKQREVRFQTAEEFQRALHRFLHSFNPEFDPADLGYYAKDLFKDEIVEDRKRIQRLNDKVEQLLYASLPPSAPQAMTPEGEDDEEDTTTAVEMAPRVVLRSENAAPLGPKNYVEIDLSKEPKKGPENPKPVLVRGGPSRGQTQIPRQKPSAGAGGGLRNAALLVAICAAGAAYLGKLPIPELPFASSRTPAQPIARVPDLTTDPGPSRSIGSVSPGKSILLRLNILPPGANRSVTIDGHLVDPDKPVALVPLDRSLRITVNQADFRAFERDFVIEGKEAGGLQEWLIDVPLDPIRFGYLTIHSTPSADATIIIDGRPWVKRTPFEDVKVPVGTYNIKLTNDLLGMEKTVPIAIKEGRTVNIEERLGVKN